MLDIEDTFWEFEMGAKRGGAERCPRSYNWDIYILVHVLIFPLP